MTNEQLYEVFTVWPAFQELHTRLLSTDPRTSDPRDLIGPLCMFGIARASCFLHGAFIGVTLEESAELVGQVLALAHDGRRPRYGQELGLRAEDFGVEL